MLTHMKEDVDSILDRQLTVKIISGGKKNMAKKPTKKVELAEFHIKEFPVPLRKRFVAEASFRNTTTPALLVEVITKFLNGK